MALIKKDKVINDWDYPHHYYDSVNTYRTPELKEKYFNQIKEIFGKDDFKVFIENLDDTIPIELTIEITE